MNDFNFDDILLFAVNIENRGEEFYKKYAVTFKDENVKSLFLFLASEEDSHRKYFTEILKTVKDLSDNTDYNDEYFGYLRAFVDNSVFDDSKTAKDAADIKDLVGALDFAMGMELKSINFYSELKNIMPTGKGEKIEIILTEEKQHYRKLSDLKSKFLGG